MNTSIYLANQNIQILTGSVSRSKVSVKNMVQAKAPEGSLINGVITSEGELAECLGRLWSQYRLPRPNVGLVIDSTKFVPKILTLPAVKGNKLQELVKREFSDLGDREKLLFDYMILKKDSRGKMLKILAAAAEREDVYKRQVQIRRSVSSARRSISRWRIRPGWIMTRGQWDTGRRRRSRKRMWYCSRTIPLSR